MKISLNTSNVINIYKNNNKHNSIENKKNKKDTIGISNTSKELAKYINAAKDYDIYNEKIEKLQKLIKDNKYFIDSEEIAKSIINELKERENI